jgi:myotubularin-related protein 9
MLLYFCRPEIEFSKLLAGDEWRISSVNENYEVCSSYSQKLVVPKKISDELIIQSAEFRELGRFPLLSYRHENGAVLLKSSQPNVNHTKRCKADEAILNSFLNKSQRGYIIDTVGGKNKWVCEQEQHYSLWKKFIRPISFGNSSSPASYLDSFAKLVEACNDTSATTEKWLSRLESSGWLSLVLSSLNTACIVAQCMAQEGAPVLVHDKYGMDSALIVTSLVQIILDPGSRTVRGLQALIDREFVQAGHPFASRHSQSCYTPPQNRSKSAGATFVLFLDCVYQLFHQFPLSFEFDGQMLLILFEHSYFSGYGTFILDNEMERNELMVFSKTTSLWSHLNRPDVITNLLNASKCPFNYY